MSHPIWQPDPQRIQSSSLGRFQQEVNRNFTGQADNYSALHRFSIEQPELFWKHLWNFCGVIGDMGQTVIADGDKLPGAQFFPDARLNFAENLLRYRDDSRALIFRGEDKVEFSWSRRELSDQVSLAAQLFAQCGVGVGDRVAAMMPNMPHTVAAMLAAASHGAIWSSCSPDFGARAVIDRFGQVEPKILIACDGYWYNGKQIELGDRLVEIRAKLPSLERIFIVDYLGNADRLAARIDIATTWQDGLAPFKPADIVFQRLPFNHPLYILYSSGTTGKPKSIVHSGAGVLLQHLKEHQLHCDLRPGDTLFYFTTCGWMMWNWLVSGLASGASLALYDGSPFYPGPSVLFDYADDAKVTMFGTSAKYIDALRNTGYIPADHHQLGSVRSVASTGSPLAAENFDYVYKNIKSDLHLASVSGGTDICACFVGGNPTAPVWRGEIQAPLLAMDVAVYGDDGVALAAGDGKGELVCLRPFPSMPVGFWNDPDGQKYHMAYFSRFEGVWCHGDFAEWTEHGGMIIHGRSDATLNPGGVRIGTAEIYAQVEQLPDIVEAIAVGQSWEGDERIILFVRLADDMTLDESLRTQIKDKIRKGASPRHVPAKILAVADIPRTKSGKITELAVRACIHGEDVKNTDALANPEALALFRDLEALRI